LRGYVLRLRDLISRKRGFILDIEGTIVSGIEGGHIYPDAQELLRFINKDQVVLLTNLARRSSKFVSRALNRFGLEVSPDRIINPTKAAVGRILRTRFKKPVRIFLISEGGHLEDLVQFDWIEFVREEPVDAVLLGASRDITYQQLNFAFRSILKGAKLIVLGGDLWSEGSQFGDSGPYLMEGAFAKALEEATGVKAIYVGKPYKEIFEEALEKLNMRREEILLIGDSIRSDIIGAYEIGLDALLIDRTGKKVENLMKYFEARLKKRKSRIFFALSLSPQSEIKEVL